MRAGNDQGLPLLAQQPGPPPLPPRHRLLHLPVPPLASAVAAVVTPTITVTVLGTPIAQGSMRSLGPGRMVHSNAATLRPWRDTVTWQVRAAMADAGLTDPLEGPVEVHATFTLARPKSAPRARWAPDKKPDIDKLLRGLLDACTAAGVWVDDAQVVTVITSKVFPHDGNVPGVTLTIAPAERGTAVAA